MERIYSKINQFFDWAIALLMGFIVILMFIEVILRYLFKSPIVWSQEIATYAFIWIIFLGAGVAFYRNAHIRVDYISQKINKEILKKLEMVLNLLLSVFFLFLLIYGMKFALMNFHSDSYTLPFIKLGWIFLAVPTGAILMLTNVIRNFLIIFREGNKRWEAEGGGCEKPEDLKCS